MARQYAHLAADRLAERNIAGTNTSQWLTQKKKRPRSASL